MSLPYVSLRDGVRGATFGFSVGVIVRMALDEGRVFLDPSIWALGMIAMCALVGALMGGLGAGNLWEEVPLFFERMMWRFLTGRDD